MSGLFPPVAELVPHEGALLLIDEVLASDDDHIRAIAIVRRECPFWVHDRGIPGYLAFEFMAQAIEKVIDKADGVRDQLAPFVEALEAMREDMRYDLRSHANQNTEENRVMRKQVREFIEQQAQATQAFQAGLLERQAKAIQIAVAHAVQAVGERAGGGR